MSFYEDLPESKIPNLPEGYDGYRPKCDISSPEMKSAVEEYLNYLSSGNTAAANAVLEQHPNLPIKDAVILAADWNEHSQRIWALERFLSENIYEDFAHQNGLVLEDQFNKLKSITLPVSPASWTYDNATSCYKYTVSVSNIYYPNPLWSLIPADQKVPTETETDNYNNIVSMTTDAEPGTNGVTSYSLTFYASAVPGVALTIGVKGVD